MTWHILLAVLAVSTLLGAPTEAPAPRLQVTMEQDAGEAMSGAPLQATFAMQNVGTAPLEITRVTPECRCMVSRYDSRLAPGARGAISVTLTTAGRHGMVEKHLTVESNDPTQPVITLILKVVLHQAVEILPAEHVRVPMRPGEAAEQELILRSYEKTPLQVTRVDCSSPTTEARVLPRDQIERRMPEAPSAFQIVRLSFPAGATKAAFDQTVTIETNSVARPSITVRLEGRPLKAFAVSPKQLDFGSVAGQGGEPMTRAIDVIRQWGPFKVLGVGTPDPRLQVRVEPDASGGLFHVVVVYGGGWKPGKVEGVITIRTDDPQRPELRVPYTAEVRAASG
jgi:hypothetical protein